MQQIPLAQADKIKSDVNNVETIKNDSHPFIFRKCFLLHAIESVAVIQQISWKHKNDKMFHCLMVEMETINGGAHSTEPKDKTSIIKLYEWPKKSFNPKICELCSCSVCFRSIAFEWVKLFDNAKVIVLLYYDCHGKENFCTHLASELSHLWNQIKCISSQL